MKFLFIFFCIFYRFGVVVSIHGGVVADRTISGVLLIDHFYGLRNLTVFPPFCTGALITTRVGITASPCCRETVETMVYVGSHNPFSGGAQMFRMVRSRYIHRQNLERRSLCLFQMDDNVVYDSQALPISLPSKRQTPTEPLHAYGFGSTQLQAKNKANDSLFYHDYMSDQLMELEMPLLRETKCDRHFHVGLQADCRGYVGEEAHKRLMPGDLGAPLIEKKTMTLFGIAITSNTKDWYDNDQPAYFINIKAHMDLITFYVKKLMEPYNEFDEVSLQ